LNTKNYLQERLLCNKLHQIKISFFFIFLLIFLPFTRLFAQRNIQVNAKNIPLNKVITDLRDRYDIKLSFNDDKLSQYKINVNHQFKTLDDALRVILKGLPLKFENSNGVYIIASQKPFLSSDKRLISGRVLDERSEESLPFSSISVNGYVLTTDLKGNFSYATNTDSAFHLQVSYLGYYKLDTIVTPSNNLEVKLRQNSIKIDEVIFSDLALDKVTNINGNGGNLKLNKSVGAYLPGNSDNAVYNLLRLQPGILASGERANDLIIWGSYQGQTKVSFDGFTIFGLKNFNDNIGAINPLIAKDVSVKKGGYGAEQGDRVGGVVDINGLEGSMFKPSLNVGINNQIMNASASAPVFKNTSLVLAARQTYYNLSQDYTSNLLSNNRNGVRRLVDLTINPDYTFRDANFKFSGRNVNGDNYFLSLFSGKDQLNSVFKDKIGRDSIIGKNDENNTQYGASGFYNKIWRNGGISSVTIASSNLDNKQSEQMSIIDDDNKFSSISGKSENIIQEQSLKFTHSLPINKKYNLYMGTGIILNNTSFSNDVLNNDLIEYKDDINRTYGFVESPYFFTSRFKITPGLRTDAQLGQGKVFFQPRLSTSFDFNDRFKTSLSWGIYRQFIAYTALIDDDGDYKYQWIVCDGETVPIYKSQHWVLDGAYEYHKFWINTSLYYKYNHQVTRLVQNKGVINTSYGDGRSYGFDFMIKKEYKSNAIWLAYSLSRTQERYAKRVNKNIVRVYERAPQDQRHEVKFAGLLSLAPFYLSANYVYGSGFRSTKLSDDPSKNVLAYNRFDTAITYKFNANKYKLETGISILNLFNTQNLKSSNYQRITTESASTINIYAQSVPFTPTIFLKLSL